MSLRNLLIASSLAITLPVWADTTEVLAQADALIRLQASDKAYEILAPLEEELAGNPNYDYLFGLALLEQNKPQLAIFAFERCLNVEPQNGPCRVQMARTHLALGEAANARAEFELIQEYNPPPEVKALASQYLGAIEALEAQQKRRITAFAQLGMGFDSNINGAPEDANKTAAALPKISGAQVNPSSIITSDDSGFASLNAGASIIYKVSPSVMTLADLSTQARSFFSDNNFDYQSIDLGVGASFDLESFTLTTKLQGQKMWLGGAAYRDVSGGLLQVQTDTGYGQVALFGQSNQLSYDTQSARDAKRTNTGLAYSHAFDMALNPSFYMSVYRGAETVENVTAKYLNQDFSGLRLGGGLKFQENISLNMQLSHEKREHNDGLYPLFSLAREDKENSANFNANWRINRHLSLIPSYTYSNNQSNIPFSDYNRHIVSVDLRCDL